MKMTIDLTESIVYFLKPAVRSYIQDVKNGKIARDDGTTPEETIEILESLYSRLEPDSVLELTRKEWRILGTATNFTKEIDWNAPEPEIKD